MKNNIFYLFVASIYFGLIVFIVGNQKLTGTISDVMSCIGLIILIVSFIGMAVFELSKNKK